MQSVHIDVMRAGTLRGDRPPKKGDTIRMHGITGIVDRVTPIPETHDELGNPTSFPGYAVTATLVNASPPPLPPKARHRRTWGRETGNLWEPQPPKTPCEHRTGIKGRFPLAATPLATCQPQAGVVRNLPPSCCQFAALCRL